MEIKYLIIHHSAVSRSKNSQQYEAINNYHKRKGWGMIGYHYLIEPSGVLKHGRDEKMRGAHCIGHNHESLGICLTGNFDKELPTDAQKFTLKCLLERFELKYPEAVIKYHRDFANKSCPGLLITDNYFNNKTMELVKEKDRPETYAVINGKHYYIKRKAFDDFLAEGLVKWEDVKETNLKISIDGVIAG